MLVWIASTRSVGAEGSEEDEDGEKGEGDGDEANMGWPWGAEPDWNTTGCATGMRAPPPPPPLAAADDVGETGNDEKDDGAAGEPSDER